MSGTPLRGRPYTPLILFLSGGQFLVTTDFSMVGTVLPRIGADLRVTPAELSGVVAVYAVVYASLLICGGRVADLWGQRRSCLLGLTVFATATLGVVCAPDFALLLAARAAQGLGAAFISPAAFSLMHTSIPEGAERHRAYRIFGSLQGAAAITGPLIAGNLTTAFGWRSAYWIEIVLTAILLTALPRVVPRRTSTRPGRLDVAGAVLIAAGITLFVIAVSGFGAALTTRARAGCGVLAVAAFLALFHVERRSAAPLIPPRLFSHPRVLTGCLGTGMAMASSASLFLLPSILMQQMLGWTAAAAGLGMLPHSLAGVLAGQSLGRLLGRFPLAQTMAWAFGLLIAGLLLYAAAITPELTYWRAILAPMTIAGAGSLLAVMLTMADAAATVADDEQGIVSALTFTAQQIGIAIGSAILLSALAAPGTAAAGAELGRAFAIAAGIAALGFICAVSLRQILVGRAESRTISSQGG